MFILSDPYDLDPCFTVDSTKEGILEESGFYKPIENHGNWYSLADPFIYPVSSSWIQERMSSFGIVVIMIGGNIEIKQEEIYESTLDESVVDTLVGIHAYMINCRWEMQKWSLESCESWYLGM